MVFISSTVAVSRGGLISRLEELEVRTAKAYHSVAGPAAEVEQAARQQGWTDLVMRARLIAGDVAGRRGDVAEQGRVAKTVNMFAREHADDVLLARSHRLLAIFFRRIGDPAEALSHAVMGLQHAGAMPAQLRCSQLITLGLLLDLNERYDDARRRFMEALDIAVAHDDADAMLTVLNNMAFTAYENGDLASANRLVRQMRSIADAHAIVLDGLYLDTMARISLAQGRFPQAERLLQPVVDDPEGPLVTEGDSLAECLLTLAEIHLRAGEPGRAAVALDRAGAICAERGLEAVGARVHQARAELHAAAGDFRAAYAEYRTFHERSEALHSAEREVRAYALQTVYDTAEALRASEQYREMALRDPLTGLSNRRYLDEQMKNLLSGARHDGEPLSVAIIDLDHFKRVNDTLSHPVGDQVLRMLGGILRDFVRGSEVAARLGGEEFILLLPGVGAAAAGARCEALAQTIRGAAWEPVTRGLPVTASIGVTTYRGGSVDVSTLLAAADHQLYRAKSNGRDRVVVDGG